MSPTIENLFPVSSQLVERIPYLSFGERSRDQWLARFAIENSKASLFLDSLADAYTSIFGVRRFDQNGKRQYFTGVATAYRAIYEQANIRGGALPIINIDDVDLFLEKIFISGSYFESQIMTPYIYPIFSALCSSHEGVSFMTNNSKQELPEPQYIDYAVRNARKIIKERSAGIVSRDNHFLETITLMGVEPRRRSNAFLGALDTHDLFLARQERIAFNDLLAYRYR